MIERESSSAKAIALKMPSFLIECLVFNAPDSCFNRDESGYVGDLKCIVPHLWGATKEDGSWRDLVEVNRRKTLFLDGQVWTRDAVHSFLYETWVHLGF